MSRSKSPGRAPNDSGVPFGSIESQTVVDVLLLVGAIAGAVYVLRLVIPSSSEKDTKDD